MMEVTSLHRYLDSAHGSPAQWTASSQSLSPREKGRGRRREEVARGTVGYVNLPGQEKMCNLR